MNSASSFDRRIRTRRALGLLAVLCALASPGPALAAAANRPPAESGADAAPASRTTPLLDHVMCTTEPRSRWISEADIRRIFGAEKYVQVKFKVSRHNCYEFYAVGRGGGVVEAYYHPVTGQLMKESRFGAESRQAP